MHESSLENMHRCFDRHVRGGYLLGKDRLTVVDIGAADVNGSYREVFSHPKFHYVGVDCQAAAGVDVVLDNPYDIPLPDRSADIVISGQMLEHAPRFWQSFREMVRLLSPDGFLFLIVPSAGPIHRYPVDCYRFYPDALDALADYGECRLLDWWRDERGPWQDLVGVYRHSAAPRAPEMPAEPDMATLHDAGFALPPPAPEPTSPDQERTSGRMPYLDFLARIHDVYSPKTYLEIGVREGDSLRLARCPAIGVDPFPRVVTPLESDLSVFTETSDAFFERREDPLVAPVDLAFIDGMHRFEFALRDLMQVERRATPWSLLAIDDVLPNHPAQAQRDRATRVWTGDVWKILPTLAQYRPELTCVLVDTAPTGMLLVAGLQPDNRVLWQHYNPAVRKMAPDAEVPADLLTRENALHPNDPRLTQLLELMASARMTRANAHEVAAHLRTWRF